MWRNRDSSQMMWLSRLVRRSFERGLVSEESNNRFCQTRGYANPIKKGSCTQAASFLLFHLTLNVESGSCLILANSHAIERKPHEQRRNGTERDSQPVGPMRIR
jgi:hypothetical protein